MRSFSSIARFTAREILSDPLSLLLTLAAAAVAFTGSVMHCHQFGEASRMARDASFSAILTGGILFSVFCTVKTVRCEFESSTLEMVLSHPVGRIRFFMAKTTGSVMALAVFLFTLSCLSLTIVRGAWIGGETALEKGDVASMWGPSAALAFAAFTLPLAFAAALNRAKGTRFVLAAMRTMPVLAAASVVYRFDCAFVARHAPGLVLLFFPPIVFAAAAAAFSMRFGSGMAAFASIVLFAAAVPALGNYCLSNALSGGGTIPWRYVALAAAAAAPAVACFLAAGAWAADSVETEGEKGI
ncbi:MAG: hypothetical protein IKD42_02470 [Kiritimatiellae bacterium]|nr:hypothetical protein [Kiritimatiellia bacterium]